MVFIQHLTPYEHFNFWDIVLTNAFTICGNNRYILQKTQSAKMLRYLNIYFIIQSYQY